MTLGATYDGPSGHRGLFVSRDRGGNWTRPGKSSFQNSQWVDIAVAAGGTHMVAATYGYHIWTSADAGGKWQRVDDTPTTQWVAVTSSANGTRLAALSQYNNITDGMGSVYTSADAGASWVRRTPPSYPCAVWQDLTSSADGLILFATQLLAEDAAKHQQRHRRESSHGLEPRHGTPTEVAYTDHLELEMTTGVGDEAALRAAIRAAKDSLAGSLLGFGRPDAPPNLVTTRFEARAREMVVGQPEFAAHGIDYFMRVSEHAHVPSLGEGIDAIVAEVRQNGDARMKECLQYVLEQPAGSSPLLFANSPFPRDCDADGLRADRKTAHGEAMRFEDFAAHPDAVRAKLHRAHVLALRLYTTAAFVSINTPLRELNATGDQCAEPHPFPNTVRFISAAIKQLRTNNVPDRVSGEGGLQYLFRGFKDLTPNDDFMKRGGSELATMSTTSSLEVAMRYAASASPILLRLKLRSFMECGADISFCSAFPAESEVIYPPMTFILPHLCREVEGITVIDAVVTVG